MGKFAKNSAHKVVATTEESWMTQLRRTQDDEPVASPAVALPKVPTGIDGLDRVLKGGLPVGRTTLVWGGPGCGKSILGLEFLYHGARRGEAGILVAFEEPAAAVRQNALTLGWDLAALEQAGKLFVLDGTPDPAAVLTGDFNLKGLLAILSGQVQALQARRVVLDASDMLTGIFSDPRQERAQFYMLHRWLLEQRLTTILTLKASQAQEPLPGYAFLDFMADCVLRLDQRNTRQLSTRRLQVIKYRGSSFESNEYPFIIAEDGIHLLPISSLALVPDPLGEVVSTGMPMLDTILGGGYWRGSCFLIPGVSGSGKTTLASTFVQAACARGEKVLFLAFEESPQAIIANMLSPGIDLRPAYADGSLRFLTAPPEAMGTEEHLFRALRTIHAFRPQMVVVDALSASLRMGDEQAAYEYAVRLLNICKAGGITCVVTSQLAREADEYALGTARLSSLVDALILLGFSERGRTLYRTLLVQKARGVAHSHQYHEFQITSRGLSITGA